MSTSLANLTKSDLIDTVPLACADEMAAIELFEQQRWGGTPKCAFCKGVNVYTIKDRKTGERRTDGRWRCRDCGKQYTVRVGQIMEDSPIPLRKWVYAFWCAASAKNGVSALEMSRKLQITYKSALYMMNRIRWAMNTTNPPKLTGTVEADETYVGGKPRYHRSGLVGRNPDAIKTPVFAVVQRGGDVHARVMTRINARNVHAALYELVDTHAHLMTDESSVYLAPGKRFAGHGHTKHSQGEYVSKRDPNIHSNTIEGFFSRVKRQIHGTYHCVSPQHLHRYLTHAAFLYNGRHLNDGQRISRLFQAAEGKRLMYKPTFRKAG